MCVVLRRRSITICRDQLRLWRSNASALARLVARRGLVDDVNASLATNQLVVAVAQLQGFERILDLHNRDRSVLPLSGNEKRAFQRAAKVEAQ
jgi:hypothetical protein